MSADNGQQRLDYTGQTLNGRYSVESLLGQGGMGSVYAGFHRLVGKRVAIKILHGEYAGNEEAVTRFFREAQTAATIAHKNVIDVLDVGVSPHGEPYFVMEYLEGESLAGMLRRVGPLNFSAALGVMEPALLALQAAHDKGVVHRDLKPDNIFLAHEPNGALTVKLIDFGISKLTGDADRKQLTQTGELMGTPMYMSPEQARGERAIDARSDIYSMGVVFYEMLTGDLPFQGDNHNQLLLNVLTEPPRPPCEVNPNFPEEALPLVQMVLSKTPAGRPASALAFLELLQQTSAFADRLPRLIELAFTLEERVCVAGDLGAAISPRKKSTATGVLFRLMQEGSSRLWFGARPRRTRESLIAAAMAVAVITFLTAAYTVTERQPEVPLKGGAPTTPAPAAPTRVHPAPLPPATKVPVEVEVPRSVRIRIIDAPTGSKILYDNAPVPMNPFPVERKDALMKLEVRAVGFQPFTTMVLPTEDREVTVRLAHAVPKRRTPAKEMTAENKPEATAPARQADLSSNTGDEGCVRPLDSKRNTRLKKPFE